MSKLYNHLKTVFKHRRTVFKLCCKFDIPFQGIKHDLSKFLPIEIDESIKYYTDGSCSPCDNAIKEKGYSDAWEHHKRINKHHFEYWYIHKNTKSIPDMPFKYALEMFCDRVAASMIYLGPKYNNSSPYDYFIERKDHYKMNNNMKRFLEESFLELSKHGMNSLNKNKLKKIYIKCTKKD